MIIISKYFNTINDYINIEKTCKEYNGLIESFHFNPIPFQNEKEREIFKNIETYHFYSYEEVKEIKESRIKEYIHWERVYSDMIKKDEKHKYKNIIEAKEMKKGTCGNECSFILYENGGMIISGNGNMKNYEWDHEREWHKEKENIKEIIIQNGIKSIGNRCFKYCSNLSTINLPTSVSSIGYGCFGGCENLSAINLPTSISSIGNNCFYSCSNLSTINLPTSISFIGYGCFSDCSELEGHISIDPNNPTFRTDGTSIYRKDNGEKVDVWNIKR